jgi:methyl acetate hydrolase
MLRRMKKPSFPAAALALALTTLLYAVATGPADIDALLRGAVEQKRVPLVVAMVADAKGVAYEQAVGAQKDAIFAIASMTKPVTSVAVMQLVEAGKIRLDEPAATYAPELATLQVLDGGGRRAPKSAPTIRQLLSHTSGFGYEFMNRQLFDLMSKKEIASFSEGGAAFLRVPLIADPGTHWEYGISTDWLGQIVERVSGQRLDACFQSKIFEPLGMTDTYFEVPAAKQARMVAMYRRGAGGALEQAPPSPNKPLTFYSGGGGLFSTAPDYLRFVRAIMAGGTLDGRRILAADTVAMMGSNQIGALTLRPFPSLIPQLATDNASVPGALDKFGLGFALNSGTAGTSRGRQTLAWAGIFNTFFWIDREKQIGAVLMTQMLPGLDPGPARLLEDFDRAVYAWKK